MSWFTQYGRCLLMGSKPLIGCIRQRPLFAQKACLDLTTPSVSLHTSAVCYPRHSGYQDPPPPRRETEEEPREQPKRSRTHKQKQSQQDYKLFSKVNSKETTVLLFPGQGSQFVGMGQGLLNTPGVMELYNSASDILGYDLLDVCVNGPVDKLNRTIYCQPAVLVTSLAAMEVLKQSTPWAIQSCVCTAGFSVGEYAALVFTGAIAFEDAVGLIKMRAEAMEKQSQEQPSGMMTVYVTHRSKVDLACHVARRYCVEDLNMEKPVCCVANFLFPECKVIAGHNQALKFLEENKEEFEIPRTLRLPVSGAFHSDVMYPVYHTLDAALKKIDIHPPIVPVYSNVTGKLHGLRNIRSLLAEQVYKPVKWEQIMRRMFMRPPDTEFPFTYEMGPGKQLGAILKRVDNKAHKQYEAISV